MCADQTVVASAEEKEVTKTLLKTYTHTTLLYTGCHALPVDCLCLPRPFHCCVPLTLISLDLLLSAQLPLLHLPRLATTLTVVSLLSSRPTHPLPNVHLRFSSHLRLCVLSSPWFQAVLICYPPTQNTLVLPS